jgi:hypothetical protein
VRERGLFELERLRQVAHAELTLRQQRDDAQASRIAQRFEDARQPSRLLNCQGFRRPILRISDKSLQVETNE